MSRVIGRINFFLIKLVGNENLRIICMVMKSISRGFLKRKLHVIGDSHAFVFNYINKERLLDEYLYVFPVEGATVQGALNPNSKTEAFKYFKRYLFWNVKSNDYLGVMLGEVDCGFVMWYRKEKYQISIEEQLAITIEKYENFLQYLKGKGIKNVILFSVPLPTIKDNEIHSSVSNLRKEISATQLEKTALTLSFNTHIGKLARKHDYEYINFSDDTLSEDTGLIDDRFLNKNLNDHHMDDNQFSMILVPRLKKYFRG